jgi:thiamine kinase-like enzyme
MVAAVMGESATGEEEAARSRLAAIPGISREAAESAPLTRLPGLTNRVYRVDLPDGRFALRIPGDGTSAIIDRETEEANARAAAKAGVAPEVIHFGADGVMLTKFVEGEPLTPERLAEAPGALERVGTALRRLHDSGVAFAGRFQPFGTIDRYRAVLHARGVALSARHQEILGEAEAVRAALAAHPVVEGPCHCDPTGRNFIDTGKRVWLVDWEYSGMNDPAWDLAYCAVQASLRPEAEATLLAAYFDRTPTAAEAARAEVMKAPVELMSALWALIQESSGNRVADFRGYAERTFEECATRIHRPEFQDQIRLVGQG